MTFLVLLFSCRSWKELRELLSVSLELSLASLRGRLQIASQRSYVGFLCVTFLLIPVVLPRVFVHALGVAWEEFEAYFVDGRAMFTRSFWEENYRE